MAQLNLEWPPKEERDQAMGRYMDAFSRLETMMRHITRVLLGINERSASPVFATLMTKQLIELLEASAVLALSSKDARRVKNLCGKLSRRNMRRNHIVHGYWLTHFNVKDGGYTGEWIRTYSNVDPALANLPSTDPKRLGMYAFTVPALDKATGHVEETAQALSELAGELPTLLARPQTPEERFRYWVEDRQAPTSGVALRLSQYRFP